MSSLRRSCQMDSSPFLIHRIANDYFDPSALERRMLNKSSMPFGHPNEPYCIFCMDEFNEWISGNQSSAEHFPFNAENKSFLRTTSVQRPVIGLEWFD